MPKENQQHGDPRHEMGRAGESHAAQWLMDCYGMKLLDRNWRHRRGELDLILRDGSMAIFVEVKVVAQNARVPGYFRVGGKQQNRIRRTALAWLDRSRWKPYSWRFDVIVVQHDGEVFTDLKHFPNILLFGKLTRPRRA